MYDLRFKRCFHLFAPPQLPGGVPKYRNSLGHAGAMNTSNSIAPHCLLVRQHAMLWKTISTATRSPAPALLSYDCHIMPPALRVSSHPRAPRAKLRKLGAARYFARPCSPKEVATSHSLRGESMTKPPAPCRTVAKGVIQNTIFCWS
jgi:hypothetical protein